MRFYDLHVHVHRGRGFDAFKESQHPRGQPENAGEFVKGGSGSKKSPAAPKVTSFVAPNKVSGAPDNMTAEVVTGRRGEPYAYRFKDLGVTVFVSEVTGQPTGVVDRSGKPVTDAVKQEAEQLASSRTALLDYVFSDAHFAVNRLLGTPQPDDYSGHTTSEEAKDLVKSIDYLMERSVLHTPAKLYRVTSLSVEPKVGNTFEAKGFLSTSKDASRLEELTSRTPDAWHLEIKVPAGTHAIDMHKTMGSQYTSQTAQKEVLLDRGLEFNIESVDPVTRKVRVSLRPGA